jgi:hypothetical protein
MNRPARKFIVPVKALTFTALLTWMFSAPAGEIAELYRSQPHAKPPTDLWNHQSITTNGTSRQISFFAGSPSFTKHGITEIGIERAPAFGASYTFIVKNDGTFRYKGVASVERLGEYTGRIDPRRFDQLAQFIKDSDYMELDDAYTSHMITDQPYVYTTVVMNGKRKTISNYPSAGPTKLWAIEQVIDDLTTQAQWLPVRKPH